MDPPSSFGMGLPRSFTQRWGCKFVIISLVRGPSMAATPGPGPFAAAAGGFASGGFAGQGYGGSQSTHALPLDLGAPTGAYPPMSAFGQSSTGQSGGIPLGYSQTIRGH